MYAIVIGASDETVYAIKTARRKGLRVMAFDGNPDAEGLLFADESYVVDIITPESICKVIEEKGLSAKDILVLPVPIGRYLTSTGACIDHFGLRGCSLQTAEICTDKWLFHQTLAAKGLRDITCSLVKKGQKPQITDNTSVIVKPRYGAGSRGCLRITCPEDWERIPFPVDEDYILEDAVEGCEYGIDGVMIHGEYHQILTRKKLLTPLPFRQCVGYLSVKKNDRRNVILTNYMKKWIEAVQLEDGIVHADVILGDSEPFVIELSARPSGHRLHDLFTPMVTGVDMISQFIVYLQGEEPDFSVKDWDGTYLIRYFDMESEIKRIPNPEEIIRRHGLLRYECNLTIGEKAKIMDGHSLMRRGFFVLKGDSEEEVIGRADAVLREYV